jgi:hypothetical protein
MATIDKRDRPQNLWQRLDGPLKIGLGFALFGILLTVVGIFRDPSTPISAWSLIVGSLISGVTWGLVSWAIATAAVEVEQDVHQAEAEATQSEAVTDTDESA